MRVLNLGAGNNPMEGATNHDMQRHRAEIDTAWDLDQVPWPWRDESFDLVHARSVFEHLRLTLIESADECWRLLAPGGRLVIVYPLASGPTAHEDPTHRWFWNERSVDYLDPDRRHGADYAYYTARKWTVLSSGIVHDRNVKAVLRVRK
jgi:predicted SAM-dependent methyltransferase